MNTLYPTYPRLQALLGAALPGLKLSNAAAEAVEDALTDAHEHAPPSAFFAPLRGVMPPMERRGASGNSARHAGESWPGRWWNRMRAHRCCRAVPMLGCAGDLCQPRSEPIRAGVMASVGFVPTQVGIHQSGP